MSIMFYFLFYRYRDQLDLHSFPTTTLFRSKKAELELLIQRRGTRKPLATAEISPVIVERYYQRSEEHTSELQSLRHLVCRLLLEKKKCPGEPQAICMRWYMRPISSSRYNQS